MTRTFLTGIFWKTNCANDVISINQSEKKTSQMQTMGTLVNYSSGFVCRVKLDVIKIHYLNKGSLNCPLLIIPGIVENKMGFFLFQKPWFISLLKTYIVPMCKCMCAIRNYTRLQQDVTIYVCVKNEAISGTRTHARAHTGTHTHILNTENI